MNSIVYSLCHMHRFMIDIYQQECIHQSLLHQKQTYQEPRYQVALLILGDPPKYLSPTGSWQSHSL